MTDTEINEAIAKAIGARFFTEDGGEFWHFVTKDGSEFGPPTRDLNAMHEAEKMLRPPIQPTWDVWENYCLMLEDDPHATASRRSEVFVKIIGKWKDA